MKSVYRVYPISKLQDQTSVCGFQYCSHITCGLPTGEHPLAFSSFFIIKFTIGSSLEIIVKTVTIKIAQYSGKYKTDFLCAAPSGFWSYINNFRLRKWKSSFNVKRKSGLQVCRNWNSNLTMIMVLDSCISSWKLLC